MRSLFLPNPARRAPALWLAILAVVVVSAAAQGFVYPLGAGWHDDLVDGLGILLAAAGGLAGALLENEPRCWPAAGAWLLGCGCALVLGQILLAAGFGAGFAAHVATARPRLELADAVGRFRAHAAALLPQLCALAALGLLLEIWEDAVETGGPAAHGLELGVCAVLLALLGLVWTARTDGAAAVSGGAGPHRIGARPSEARPYFLAAAGLLAGFLLLAAALRLPFVQHLDTGLSGAFYHSGSRFVTRAMRAVSAAGGRDLALYWIPLVAFGLLAARRGDALRFFAAGMIGAVGLEVAAKLAIHRLRPEFVQGLHFDSFPSGHVLAATALAGLLLRIVLPSCRWRWQRVAATAAALLWPLLMAASRVYLGRHYPTDVLASGLLGTGWVALCEGLLRGLAPRSTPPTAP